MAGNKRKKSTTRRPKGSGSEWRDKNGKCHARIEITPNPRTGKRRTVSAEGDTFAQARARLADKIALRQQKGELPLTDVPTMRLWCERWLNQTARRVKPRVLETYRSDCRAIIGCIGGIRLDEITAMDIENMCADLSTGRSSKTVHNYFIRCQQILAAAVREKIIDINPALAAMPPRWRSSDTRILKPGEPARAIAAAKSPARRKWDKTADEDGDMWALMFHLAFATGMRQAERFAITPSELVTIDGVHGIDVQWELQYLPSATQIPNWLRAKHLTGRFWLIEPKTRSSTRFVPLDTELWLGLNALAKANDCGPDDLIFTRQGNPLTSGVERRRWKRACEDAGIPEVTMRSARHFFSTHLAETGASEDARKAMMGHAKITTTARYTHWSTAALASLAADANTAIGTTT